MVRMRVVVAAVAAGALLTVGGVVPAEAGMDPPDDFGELFTSYPITVNGTYTPIIGDGLDCSPFGGSIGVIWYSPGSGADWRWRDLSFTAEFGVEYFSEAVSVNGTYEPFVGDFDGDFCDDVFWYAPGAAADFIWYGAPDGGFETHPVTVNGDYTPLVGDWDSADDGDDIFWYGSGGGAESIWRGSTTQGSFVVAGAPQVAGTDFLATSLGEEVLFYRPGPGADYIWRGPLAGATAPTMNIPITINRTYQPYYTTGGWLLYGPGTAKDTAVYGHDDVGNLITGGATINGTYRVAVSQSPSSAYDIIFHAPGPGQDYFWYGD